jgi:hypothetical protein
MYHPSFDIMLENYHRSVGDKDIAGVYAHSLTSKTRVLLSVHNRFSSVLASE